MEEKKPGLITRLLWWVECNIVYGETRNFIVFIIICNAISVITTIINIAIFVSRR